MRKYFLIFRFLKNLGEYTIVSNLRPITFQRDTAQQDAAQRDAAQRNATHSNL